MFYNRIQERQLMTYILIHGLGQDSNSWGKVEYYLTNYNQKVEVPNLFKISKGKSFDNLYNDFEKYCNSFNDKLNLCGLSLGEILALEYTKKFPNKVNSLIIIGVPYKIPKLLFSLQNIIFKFLPNNTFEKIGTTKKDFCLLVNSMKNINILKNTTNIKCKTLVLCGKKDKTNLKNIKLLSENIQNSKVELINNSGHEVNVDNPQELFNKIYKFLENNNKD